MEGFSCRLNPFPWWGCGERPQLLVREAMPWGEMPSAAEARSYTVRCSLEDLAAGCIRKPVAASSTEQGLDLTSYPSRYDAPMTRQSDNLGQG